MKITFIGAGVMGHSMIRNLCLHHHEVHVYNRTFAKAQACEMDGAIAHEKLEEAIQHAEVIITIVGYPKDVKEVYEVIFQHAQINTIAIDMTTSSPSLARELDKEAKKHHIQMLDAPVSGGDTGAKNGTLSIMVGGDKDVFEQCLPIFNCLGKNIVYMGEAGAGQHTKMANQIAIAGTIAAVAEALCYAEKAGLNPQELLNAISAGAAGSWQMNNNAPKMLAEDYAPGFYIKHFIKDMNLAQQEADGFNVELPILNQVEKMYQQLAESGYENDGTQAIWRYFKN